MIPTVCSSNIFSQGVVTSLARFSFVIQQLDVPLQMPRFLTQGLSRPGLAAAGG